MLRLWWEKKNSCLGSAGSCILLLSKIWLSIDCGLSKPLFKATMYTQLAIAFIFWFIKLVNHSYLFCAPLAFLKTCFELWKCLLNLLSKRCLTLGKDSKFREYWENGVNCGLQWSAFSWEGVWCILFSDKSCHLLFFCIFRSSKIFQSAVCWNRLLLVSGSFHYRSTESQCVSVVLCPLDDELTCFLE